MKYYNFYRESNDFTDILNDMNIKSNICVKMTWSNHLLIGLKYNVDDSILGYIVLKYGDDIVKLTDRDYSPKPYVDYIPLKK